MTDEHRQRPGWKRWGWRFCCLMVPLALTGLLISKSGMAIRRPVFGGAQSASSRAASRTGVKSSAQTAERQHPVASKGSAKKLIDVPHIGQKGLLSSGCELVSAMMLLKYYSRQTTVDEIVRRTPQSNLLSAGTDVFGMSPCQAFIGNPRSADGFGCYAPVLAAVIDSYFPVGGPQKAVNDTGTDLESLVRDHVEKDAPVLIWATVGMEEPQTGKSWTLADTGQSFHWISREHCLVLVGYDPENYYFNDPNHPSGVTCYKKSLVEKRYLALGKQAVSVHANS